MLMLAASPVIFSSNHRAVAAPAHEQTGRWETRLNLTDAQKTQIKQIHESARTQINGILTPDQQTKIQQAKQQHTRPQLNLTDDQKAKIRAIKQNSQSQIKALLTPAQQQQLQQLHQRRLHNYQEHSHR
jgi:protein CpxP